MIIKNMIHRTDFTTWRLIETKLENPIKVVIDTELIWELTWLEPHVRIALVFINNFIDTLIHGLQIVFVEVSSFWHDSPESIGEASP